jgi:uncharacterized membrane protein
MPWLFLAYPVAAHLATVLHSPMLASLALLIFVALPLLSALLALRLWAWIVLVVTAVLIALAARSGVAPFLMYAPPVLIPLAVLAVFAHSLRPGQQPMVTRVASQMRGAALPDELQLYTRQVTQAWVILLAALALGALLLARFASREFWSLMTNIVMYLMLGGAFVVEYLYRRWRFRHLRHESFVTMIAALVRRRQ